MSRFRVCARIVRDEARPPGMRFIHFHWCVEACSRLTGEPFGALFARLGARHGFGREPGAWPDGAKLSAALAELEEERRRYLARLQALVLAQRERKAAGQRGSVLPELRELEARRAALHERLGPKRGPWRYRGERLARRR